MVLISVIKETVPETVGVNWVESVLLLERDPAFVVHCKKDTSDARRFADRVYASY
jgi:hypothetical protein